MLICWLLAISGRLDEMVSIIARTRQASVRFSLWSGPRVMHIFISHSVILLSALSVCRDPTVSYVCLSRSYCQLCPSVAILLSALSVCRDPTISSVRLSRSYCQLCPSVAIPLSALSVCCDPTVSSVCLYSVGRWFISWLCCMAS